MERLFTVTCHRDERGFDEIVHAERTELVAIRGCQVERVGADGYLEPIAAYDPGPRSWYGFDDCDRYDYITIKLEPSRRLLVELLDEQNQVREKRELGSVHGLRLDRGVGKPRLLFIGPAGLADGHADPRFGLWHPNVDAQAGFGNLRFRTLSLFELVGVPLGPRLRPSGLAARLAA